MSKPTKRRNVAVIDCETDPFLHNRTPEPFIWGYYNGTDYLEFDETSKLIGFLRDKPARETIYAHNGGKFDFHFLLAGIDQFKPITIINGRLVKLPFGNVELRDSFSIIPTPLAAFEKMDFEYWKLEKKVRHKYMSEIRTYLKSDCVNLYNYVMAFIERYGLQITLASTAMKECLKLLNIKSKVLHSSHSFYEMFYPFYFGGRVQAFERGTFKEKTYTYDINSAYPYAMLHNHPIGTECTVTSNVKLKKVIPTDFYIIDAEVQGALPERTLPLSFPTTKGIFFTTGYELQAGLDTNTIQISRILRHYHFPKVITFGKFVNHYYEQKRNSAKGSVEYIFAKLMLNSLYGKFAANPENYHDYTLIPAQFIDAAGEVDGYDFGGFLGQEHALMYKPLAREKQTYYNIATAASITGLVRAFLWRSIHTILLQQGRVFYCDTDSIITNSKIETSSDIGQWKIEQENDQTIIIAPKLYGTRNAKTHEWKIASKGIEIGAKELKGLTREEDYTYKREAPTFSINEPPKFISRTIRAL